MNRVRRRALVGLIILALAQPIIIWFTLTHHHYPIYLWTWVAVNACVLGVIVALILRYWIRQGIRSVPPFLIAVQASLIAILAMLLALALRQ